MDQKLPLYQSRMLELTVIPHSDIRDDLLQHRLPFRELLVLRFRRLQFRAKLLRRTSFENEHGRSPGDRQR